jgi:ribosomal protein S30
MTGSESYFSINQNRRLIIMKSYTMLTLTSLILSVPLVVAEPTTTPSSESQPTKTVIIKPVTSPPTKEDSESLESVLKQYMTKMEGLMTRMLDNMEAMHNMMQKLTTPQSTSTPILTNNLSSLLPSPIQQHRQQMRAQMEQIQQTTDPEERQKLLQEHLQYLQKVRKMTPSIMARGQMNYSQRDPRNRDLMNARIDKIEQRLNDMLILLEQIQAHQQAMESIQQ